MDGPGRPGGQRVLRPHPALTPEPADPHRDRQRRDGRGAGTALPAAGWGYVGSVTVQGTLVEVRGTRLFVYDVGRRDAPALVYLHGGPGMGCRVRAVAGGGPGPGATRDCLRPARRAARDVHAPRARLHQRHEPRRGPVRRGSHQAVGIWSTSSTMLQSVSVDVPVGGSGVRRHYHVDFSYPEEFSSYAMKIPRDTKTLRANKLVANSRLLTLNRRGSRRGQRKDGSGGPRHQGSRGAVAVLIALAGSARRPAGRLFLASGQRGVQQGLSGGPGGERR